MRGAGLDDGERHYRDPKAFGDQGRGAETRVVEMLGDPAAMVVGVAVARAVVVGDVAGRVVGEDPGMPARLGDLAEPVVGPGIAVGVGSDGHAVVERLGQQVAHRVIGPGEGVAGPRGRGQLLAGRVGLALAHHRGQEIVDRGQEIVDRGQVVTGRVAQIEVPQHRHPVGVGDVGQPVALVVAPTLNQPDRITAGAAIASSPTYQPL